MLKLSVGFPFRFLRRYVSYDAFLFLLLYVCFPHRYYSLTFLRRSHVSCRYLPPLMSLLLLSFFCLFSYFLVLPTFFLSSASHSGLLTFSRRKNYPSRDSPADGMVFLLKAFPISSISVYSLLYFILYCDWAAHGRSGNLRFTCANKVSHTHTHGQLEDFWMCFWYCEGRYFLEGWMESQG